jgi:hypothetical protein
MRGKITEGRNFWKHYSENFPDFQETERLNQQGKRKTRLFKIPSRIEKISHY